MHDTAVDNKAVFCRGDGMPGPDNSKWCWVTILAEVFVRGLSLDLHSGVVIPLTLRLQGMEFPSIPSSEQAHFQTKKGM